MVYGGGGNVLDDIHSITRSLEKGEGHKRHMPKTNSLEFFVQTSEERVEKVRRG
jgi:hypothetical protein